MNQYLRANHLAQWTTLHGDDENGETGGFHHVPERRFRPPSTGGQNPSEYRCRRCLSHNFEIRDGQFPTRTAMRTPRAAGGRN